MIEFPFKDKQIREALADKGSLVRVIMDSLPDCFFIKDKDLRFIGANKALADLMGFADPKEMVGKTDFDVFRAEEAQQLHEDDLRAMNSGRPLISRGRQVQLKNAQKIWLSEHRIPLTDEHGNVAGLVGVFRDITKVRNMEQDLRMANMRLSGTLAELKQAQQGIIQNERLNALGEMASGIAHDFNNALMPVLGYSDIMIAKPEILNNRDEALGMIRDIRMAAMDASQAIRRLREFYRPAADGEETAGDLNKQIRTSIVLTRPKWEAEMGAKGVRIKIETELEDIAPVRAKESRLREVLLNLILNAVDAMPQGGTLTIRTRAEGEEVVLEIADTGTGMTEEVRKRCLDPFFSTKGDAGTGLGLSLAYGFVQRHKGALAIDTAPGKGTTITIRLPCFVEGAPPSDEPVAPVRLLVKGKRVLVVDDELAARRLLSRYLETDDHVVQTADGGRDGIEKFHAGKFDLVITDRAMADMSGDEVAVAIRKENAQIPILMLTGFGDIMNEDGLCPPGVNLVLAKPITHAILREGIAKLMPVPAETP